MPELLRTWPEIGAGVNVPANHRADTMRKRDYRSAEAAAYRILYKSRRWRLLRLAQFARQPLCERCLDRGKVTVATVANHRRPHKGDLELFFDQANLESACKPCHDGPIQSDERRGYSSAADADGWPTDPHHPSNG